jgi:cellobiose-specific phosphotransferase system component IIC
VPRRPPSPIIEYYKSFLSILGALAALVAASPLLSKALPAEVSQHIFPPLGQMESSARVGAVAFALLATYVAFFLGSSNATIKVVLAASLAFVSFVAFLALSSRLVRTIDVPSQGASLTVSVGFERSDFAKNNFANDSDWEMLRHRGMSDEEIEKLWTPNSVIAGRLALWISCVGFVVASVFALCFGVLSQTAAAKSLS